MTPLLASAAVGATLLALAALAWPLVRPPRAGGAPAPPAAEQDWADTKARLVAQMRDNDLALAEGRISAQDHAETGARLAEEAEAAVSWLRQSRAGRAVPAAAPEPAADPRGARGWLAVTALALPVVVAGAVFFAFGLSGDLDMRASPHADGTVPLVADAAAPAMPPMGADGAPDIGAMVTRLEARIAEGVPSTQDLQMLMRSYATLGRTDEILPLFEALFARFPDRTDYRIAFVRAAVGDPDLAPPGKLGEQIETILLADPDNLELRWYRGLTLARLGHFAAARAELEWLRPRMAETADAQEAIALLLSRLPDTPPPPAGIRP